ncbi:MAG: nitrilase-related carbon-nitrogen hydrolase [Brachybacterium sp.]|nr:nitrilase-related carbon-nitrogen hydrolase [Brachybacterium sp.]
MSPEDRPARRLRCALAQVTGQEDISATLTMIEGLVLEAAHAGADLVVFPEATLTPFGTDLARAARADAARFDEHLSALAAEHALVIIAGSFTLAADGRTHNTLIVRGPGVHADYAKIHLFDAFGTRESDTIAPGDDTVTIDVQGVRIGLATCYDVRFPELFTRLAEDGADLVVLPAAWGDGPGKTEQLRLLLRARALDATVALVAVDQAPPPDYRGKAPRGVGHSAVIGPLGQVHAELGRDPGMLVVDLDPADVAAARETLPVLRHRRSFPPPRGAARG